jgi:hypothetical protein
MNVPCGTRVPALSSNEVTAGLPAYAVAAASAVGVGSLGATIGPPAVKAAVVGTLGRGSASTCSKSSQRASSKVGDWGSESTGSRNGSSEDGCEGNHFSGCDIGVVCRIEVWVRERMTVVRNRCEGESSCSYTFRQGGSWLRSWSGRPGLVGRDDERMVVEYERCLSDCSQDGMNDRKREALIWCAWLV